MRQYAAAPTDNAKPTPRGRRPLWSLVAVLAGLVILGCGMCEVAQRIGLRMDDKAVNNNRKDDPNATRTWAQRIELVGVPNLHRVSRDLYRGAQPTEEGIRRLKALGVKTLVNLRTLHSDPIGDTNGVTGVAIATQPWDVEPEDVALFLKIATDPNRTPVFVHCQRGADRTGTMCAVYRMVVEGWAADQALQEMRQGGFGFYEGWTNLVDYIRHLDVNQIRAQVGLPAHREDASATPKQDP